MSQKAICQISGQEFEIFDEEIRLCKFMDVPLPTLCADERFRRLMSFRNEWKLYRRKCDATGEEILSAYDQDSPYKVYQNKIWWGDSWDALDYGREFDFNRPFFEQFKELQLAVPREGTSIFNSENCAYNSHIRESRNCYLNSLVARCEDVYYSYWMVDSKNVFDSLLTNDSTLCYYCLNVNHSYNCAFLDECDNCSECYFSYQLRGCKNCIFSSNLANKTYYAFNKSCTKEDFEILKNKYLNGSHQSLQEAKIEFEKISKSAIHKNLHNLNCENVTGDHLYNCRNCRNTYDGFNSEGCFNTISLGDATNIHSCYSAGWPNCPGPVYMSVVSRACQNVAFGNYNWYSSKLRYCEGMNACDSCFGCIGLRHKNYCILNKQYSKEEYEKMIPKIIAHMQGRAHGASAQAKGESGFASSSDAELKNNQWGKFPVELSAFAYNETAAQDFYPLTKEQALKMGYTWKDENTKEYKPATLEILACEKCKKNYKIIEPELKFYRQMNLPIPRICSECRHKERSSKRAPFKLFTRTCNNCGKKILSVYDQSKTEAVYCEECYLQIAVI